MIFIKKVQHQNVFTFYIRVRKFRYLEVIIYKLQALIFNLKAQENIIII